jgi:hypothetical protein
MFVAPKKGGVGENIYNMIGDKRPMTAIVVHDEEEPPDPECRQKEGDYDIWKPGDDDDMDDMDGNTEKVCRGRGEGIETGCNFLRYE